MCDSKQPLDGAGSGYIVQQGIDTPPAGAQMTFFDGQTYQPVRASDPGSDRQRLTRQLAAVTRFMADGLWHTLPELADAVGCTTQSASARLRDLRKERFGAHTVERRYLSAGLFEYRLIPMIR